LGIVVYGLSSSRHPDAIRYIGQSTAGAETRLRQHLKTISKPRTSMQKWMRRVVDSGHTVQVKVLLANAVLGEDEARLIAEYRASGANLLNRTCGGGGTSGYRHTEAEKQRRSDRATGRKHTEATKVRLSAALKLVPQSQAFRAICTAPKYAAKNPFFGKAHTEASRHANGKARAKLDDDTVRRIRSLRLEGRTQDSLAAEFRMSQAQISVLVRGETYGWVR
jgi:hypothetical protein